jgi:hypothetical protein
MLVVSRDRFAVADEWYASQAVVRVDDQSSLRLALSEGRLDARWAESLVEVQDAVPLRRADVQADRFIAALRSALADAGGDPVAVRVSEPRWAAALREYVGRFPALHVLPGQDPLVVCLSAACLRVQARERRRLTAEVESRREWTAFSRQSGRGHVALGPRRGRAGAPEDDEAAAGPLQIASDGARNPRRGASWGYFTSEGMFRLGVCAGGIVSAELRGLGMALGDHPDVPVVVWTDSRRALGLVNALLCSGEEPGDRALAREARQVAELVDQRRGAGLATTLRWVRAHTRRLASAPTVLNDAADRLAKLALRRWCTPGLSDGVEEIALSIAHEAARSLGELEDL